MREFGEYVVSGGRDYRGHAPGTRFVARLDRGAEVRAIRRGDIRLRRRVIPSIRPGALTHGWLIPAEQTTTTRGAGRRPAH